VVGCGQENESGARSDHQERSDDDGRRVDNPKIKKIEAKKRG